MKGNLLIVDDEVVLAENMKDLLEGFADHIFLANEGITALNILDNEKIDCVICDISMPGIGGFEIIKQVRDKGNTVPFIFFTAYGLKEFEEKALKFEKSKFILKPDTEALEQELEIMIKQSLEVRNELK